MNHQKAPNKFKLTGMLTRNSVANFGSECNGSAGGNRVEEGSIILMVALLQ